MQTQAKHYGKGTLDWVDVGGGWKRAALILEDGETAWKPRRSREPLAPGEVREVITGPASLMYEQGPDGACRVIDAS